MQQLIDQLTKRYPDLLFRPSDKFYWSPKTREIFYNQAAKSRSAGWSLLHETGHALLDHQTYQADYELLRLEVDAWQRARQLAAELGTEIDDEHIQDCLDTYRDWLNKRSICPTCGCQSLQQGDFDHYRCFNCRTTWRVSANRFARGYRSTTHIPDSTPVFT